MTDQHTRRYRTEIPNIIDDSKLSVYAFRLYVHIKRVAGEDGSCWQGTRTLAEHCGMSTGQVSKAKAELKAGGFITISEKPIRGGSVDDMRPVDMWQENVDAYAKCSSREHFQKDSDRDMTTVSPESVHVVNTNGESVHTTNAGVHVVNAGVHTVNAGVHTVNERKHQEERTQKNGGERVAQPAAHTPAVDAFFSQYPSEQLSAKEMRAISSTATDVPAWRSTLQLWDLNGYRVRVGDMLDRYRKIAAEQAPPPIRTNGKPTSPARPSAKPFSAADHAPLRNGKP